MKRVLAFLLCVCLLVPFVSVTGITVLAEEKEKEYIIKELPAFQANVTATLTVGGGMWTSPNVKFEPIDLTRYGYDKDPASVGFQMDTFVTGDQAFMEYMNSGYLGGQFEITSSGVPDENEIMAWPNSLSFGEGEWKRIVLPFSLFAGTGFNSAGFNFTRLHLIGPEKSAPDKYAGATGTFKIANLCVVDLTVAEEDRPTAEEMPLGDGTFEPHPPVWKEVQFTKGYDDSTKTIAGYNLKEYVSDYEAELMAKGFDYRDYTSVVNSLLEGLSNAGGGTLFIPAGNYPFYGNVRVPAGVSIIGEWLNPDDHPEIRGTILEVYGGRGSTDGAAFISMSGSSKLSNFNIWYPEQTVENIAMYPPSISTGGYTFVQNVTLVNSYFGIQNVNTANSPNAWDVYGTPLNIGIDFDHVIDIARIQNIRFAAKYWERSGLPNAPTTDKERETLKNQLYDYAIGIILRRIDWSYAAFCDIRGYNMALFFDISAGGGYPNGQCTGFEINGCKYGVFAHGISGNSEMLTDFVIKNCEYGIYLPEGADGVLQMTNMDIQATQAAVFQASAVRMSMHASTVRGGTVSLKGGNNILINNRLMTTQPQVVMDYGTVSAVLLGNTDSYHKEIVYDNIAFCSLKYEAERADIDEYTPVTKEELEKEIGPAGNASILADDMDTTGNADVTEALQKHLTTLGKQGGGTLFLIPGIYRVDGTLDIPSGVELRGTGDFGAQARAKNSIIMVYTPIEKGKTQYTTTATVTLAENSGVRGVIFNYPMQNATYRVVDKAYNAAKSKQATEAAQAAENKAAKEEGREPITVAPIDVYDDYYEFDFIPYPFLFRGTGSDIYIVNTSVRNGWNSVDFKTYRCDNHYIDYVAGHFYNRGFVVGNGSTGGIIRNYQLNYNSILEAPGKWAGFGGFENSGALGSAFHQPMQAQFNNNSIVLQLGDVNDQIVHNCFNYAGYIGVHLVDENGQAANARIFGHGVDYQTVGIKIEAMEDVQFAGYQACAFNQAGSDDATGRWAVNQATDPIYDIWLTKTFNGEVTLANMVEWGPSANAAIRVDGGKLTVVNATINHDNTKRFEMNNDGILSMYALQLGGNWQEELASENQDQLFIKGGCYTIEPPAQEKMGDFSYMFPNRTRWSVPQNVSFTEDSELMATEAFDGYAFSSTSDYRVQDATNANVRRGEVRLRQNAMQFMQGLTAGQNAKEKTPFELTAGTKKDLYRLEWRFKVDSMRDVELSEITLYISAINQSVRNEEIITIDKTGGVYLKDNSKLADITFGTYYRLAVEYDARNKDAKTVRVYLLDDDSAVVASGNTATLPASFQGEINVSGFWVMLMADTDDAIETETDMYIDYFYASRSETSTIGRNTDGDIAWGDVNADNKIDSTDARLVLQYAVGKVTSLANQAAADVNGDNKIDSTDARLILQYAVGKITKFSNS